MSNPQTTKGNIGSDHSNEESVTFDKAEMTEIDPIEALKSFPLPSHGNTSEKNYQRILDWLYEGKRTVAGFIIDLNVRKP